MRNDLPPPDAVLSWAERHPGEIDPTGQGRHMTPELKNEERGYQLADHMPPAALAAPWRASPAAPNGWCLVKTPYGHTYHVKADLNGMPSVPLIAGEKVVSRET